MIAKVHELEMKSILAVCDNEHLGKTFEDGKISFRVSEKFFGGEAVSKEKLRELSKGANAINAFGNKCTSVLEREGLISENSVILIDGIKHAQVYKV